MNRTQWMVTWQRLRQRWGEWTPTKVEEDDWCLGLLRYSPELVEEVARHVASTFSANIPRLAWVLRECEKRRVAAIHVGQESKPPDHHVDEDEFLKQREIAFKQLEDASVDDLRKAYQKAIEKYPMITRAEDGDTRNWKSTLRAAVLSELKGVEE
jgi:hypothetical protein